VFAAFSTVAVNCCVPPEATVALIGKIETETAGGGLTVRVNAFVAFWDGVAVTWTVNEYCPEELGVPAMTPVELPSASPGGNEPTTTLQL